MPRILFVLLVICNPARGEVGPTVPLPPLEITRGLPSHPVCQAAATAAADNYTSILKRHGYANDEGLDWGIVLEADAAWISKEIWEAAEEATNAQYTDIPRQIALHRLIEMAGWRAVLTGQLPNPVP